MSKARSSLIGTNPRERGYEKQRIALDWIYRWGWSSEDVLHKLTGSGASKISNLLIENKLILSTPNDRCNVFKDAPAHLLTLTETGLEAAERDCEYLIRYEIKPSKLKANTIVKENICQMLTAKEVFKKSINEFQTSREFLEKSSKKERQHDVIWGFDDKTNVGVEVALSINIEQDFNKILKSCLESLGEEVNTNKEINKIIIYIDSIKTSDKFEKYFTSNKSLEKIEFVSLLW
jgi:hypothetical protein